MYMIRYSFLLKSFIKEVFIYYQLGSSQLHPNRWIILSAFNKFYRLVRIEPTINVLRSFYHLVIGIDGGNQCFETRPGPGPGWPGAGTRAGWWKNSISHDPVWPGWPNGLTRWPGWPGKTRSKPRLQPVDFCFFFFTKTTPFWIFLKIGIDPADLVKTRWPGQNPEPGP